MLNVCNLTLCQIHCNPYFRSYNQCISVLRHHNSQFRQSSTQNNARSVAPPKQNYYRPPVNHQPALRPQLLSAPVQPTLYQRQPSPVRLPASQRSFTGTTNVGAAFSLKLLQNINGGPGKNLIFSPVAVQFLLSLLENGSGGKTKLELQNVLGVTFNEEVNKALRTNTPGLKTALGIFYDNNVPIKDGYRNKYSKLATIFPLDFRNPNTLAKAQINQWASKATEGRINNLIPANYDLSSVNLVLTSALYFHNTWKYKFQPIGNEIFVTGEGKSIQAPFMEFTQNIVFYEINFNGINSVILSIPYENPKYSMIIIIPLDNVPLDNLIQNITPAQFNEILTTSKDKFPRYIKLKMPKFSIKSRLSLVAPLIKMQIKELFSSRSNLSGLSSGNVYVSDILQQSTLDVDENGTVAASATGGLVIPLSANGKTQPLHVKLGKPFLSIIIDQENRTPLFISKISQPEF